MFRDVDSSIQGMVSLFPPGGVLTVHTDIHHIEFNPSGLNPWKKSPGHRPCSLFSLFVVVSVRYMGDPGPDPLAGEPL